MYTFQDFEQATDKAKFVSAAISEHLSSDSYKTAVKADLYDCQKNETIFNYVKVIFSMTGSPIEDFTASNNKIASNFFHRLNTQRATYLLGNGVSFTDNVETQVDENGIERSIDTTKERLGAKFDTDLKNLAYYGLIHGVSFGYWTEDSNKARLHVFKLTEFKPLFDEETGALRAGIRFWRVEENKPLYAVLYEKDGYTKYKGDYMADLQEIEPKRAYKYKIQTTEFDGDLIIGEENFTDLPIVPFYGTRVHQSTLIGMQSAIDSYDLIRSGFANDLSDCAMVYWILENAGGMSDKEVERYRERLKFAHIAVADTDNSKVTPYTQDIPYNARQAYLNAIREGIYEDFGGLDVHTVAAGATNDHIDAAYQPLDEEADDLEFQVHEFMDTFLDLLGIEDTATFKRNRISNQKEQTDMVLSASDYLDDETILKKLPFITVDEVVEILARKNAENEDRYSEEEMPEEGMEETEEPEETEDDSAVFDSMISEIEAQLDELLSGLDDEETDEEETDEEEEPEEDEEE